MRGYRSCPADAQPTGGALSHRILRLATGAGLAHSGTSLAGVTFTPAQPPLLVNSPGEKTNLTQKQPRLVERLCAVWPQQLQFNSTGNSTVTRQDSSTKLDSYSTDLDSYPPDSMCLGVKVSSSEDSTARQLDRARQSSTELDRAEPIRTSLLEPHSFKVMVMKTHWSTTAAAAQARHTAVSHPLGRGAASRCRSPYVAGVIAGGSAVRTVKSAVLSALWRRRLGARTSLRRRRGRSSVRTDARTLLDRGRGNPDPGGLADFEPLSISTAHRGGP